MLVEMASDFRELSANLKQLARCIKTLETNIKLKQLYKNLSGTSGHTKSTDLIIAS
jgi:hypothetical protein